MRACASYRIAGEQFAGIPMKQAGFSGPDCRTSVSPGTSDSIDSQRIRQLPPHCVQVSSLRFCEYSIYWRGILFILNGMMPVLCV
jgi:hypothetical protein